VPNSPRLSGGLTIRSSGLRAAASVMCFCATLARICRPATGWLNSGVRRMERFPPGFPLDALDNAGNTISVGDNVVILVIPEWLVHDLPQQEAEHIKSCVGEETIVREIDRYGYLWVHVVTSDSNEDYSEQRFAMEPQNVLKVSK
jgi:hypothetical protein